MPRRYSGDALMKANDDVTETLRRTISLMQGELEKSVLSTQMFGMYPRFVTMALTIV